MLKNGERIKLGEQEYEVTKADRSQLACISCDIKNCYKNKELDVIKAHHFALSCVDLIPGSSYFKKVEQSPQVDCK